jgi:ribosomal-protein-alanine N-acetyltransferase
MRTYRSELAKALLSGASFEELNRSDCADGVLDPLEDWGTLVNRGIVPDYVMWTTSGWYILRYWRALLPYIKWVRTHHGRMEHGDPTYFQEFERLHRRIVKLEERGRRRWVLWHERNPFSLDERDLNQFLIEELGAQPFALRRCEPSDLPRVEEIENAAFEEVFRYPRTKFDELYQEHKDGFIVAELLGKKVVGYVIVYTSAPGSGEIDSLAVDPNFQRVGLGTLLSTEALKRLRSQGTKLVSLEVDIKNVDSLRLFGKLGFRTRETLDNYYAAGVHAHRMTLALSADQG